MGANAELAWLATDPTNSGDPDFIIMGDLNAYSKEDPIAALEAAGYTNLEAAFEGPDAYSYVFFAQAGSLDHSMASASLLSQVNGATTWHVNADEPSVLDYNEDFKSPGQIISLYNADQYRTSDHDPLLIGLNLTPTEPPNIEVDPQSLSSTQLPDTQVVQTLTISNTGGMPLEWQIYEEPVAGPPEAVQPVTRIDSQATMQAELTGEDNAAPTATGPRDMAAAARAQRMLGTTGLLLIPESTNDRVMAFDPFTGNLVDADFIPADPDNLSTPIHAILSASGNSILVSDQLDDVVQEYGLDGSYIGVFAPAGGVNNAILDNIRGISLRNGADLLVTVGGGANDDAVAQFDTSWHLHWQLRGQWRRRSGQPLRRLRPAGRLVGRRHHQRCHPHLRPERRLRQQSDRHQHLPRADCPGGQQQRAGGQLQWHRGRRGRVPARRHTGRHLRSGRTGRLPRRLRAGQRQPPDYHRLRVSTRSTGPATWWRPRSATSAAASSSTWRRRKTAPTRLTCRG